MTPWETLETFEDSIKFTWNPEITGNLYLFAGLGYHKRITPSYLLMNVGFFFLINYSIIVLGGDFCVKASLGLRWCLRRRRTLSSVRLLTTYFNVIKSLVKFSRYWSLKETFLQSYPALLSSSSMKESRGKTLGSVQSILALLEIFASPREAVGGCAVDGSTSWEIVQQREELW